MADKRLEEWPKSNHREVTALGPETLTRQGLRWHTNIAFSGYGKCVLTCYLKADTPASKVMWMPLPHLPLKVRQAAGKGRTRWPSPAYRWSEEHGFLPTKELTARAGAGGKGGLIERQGDSGRGGQSQKETEPSRKEDSENHGKKGRAREVRSRS